MTAEGAVDAGRLLTILRIGKPGRQRRGATKVGNTFTPLGLRRRRHEPEQARERKGLVDELDRRPAESGEQLALAGGMRPARKTAIRELLTKFSRNGAGADKQVVGTGDEPRKAAVTMLGKRLAQYGRNRAGNRRGDRWGRVGGHEDLTAGRGNGLGKGAGKRLETPLRPGATTPAQGNTVDAAGTRAPGELERRLRSNLKTGG